MIGIHTYLTHFVHGYGYKSCTDFAMSLCPSFKYNMQVPTLSLSAIIATISHWLGASPIIMFAMLVAVIIETVTGIMASQKAGIKFESFKFSRCIIKVFIWLALVFITNCFCLECQNNDGWVYTIGGVFFDMVKMIILTYFVVEYLVSIMENLAVIDGKPKTTFIDTVKDVWSGWIEKLKNKP